MKETITGPSSEFASSDQPSLELVDVSLSLRDILLFSLYHFRKVEVTLALFGPALTAQVKGFDFFVTKIS